MHRAYQPITPASSRLLAMKWDQRYYDEHRRKLAEITPTIDTTAPRTYMHMHLKPKKLQLEEERLATIERDNRILLEKISRIMRTRGSVDNHNETPVPPGGCRTLGRSKTTAGEGTEGTDSGARTTRSTRSNSTANNSTGDSRSGTEDEHKVSAMYEIGSLCREQRKREVLQIGRENQRIIRRIVDVEPTFSIPRLERDWSNTMLYLDQISHYPREWWKDENYKSSRSGKSRKGKSKDKKGSSEGSEAGASTKRSEVSEGAEGKEAGEPADGASGEGTPKGASPRKEVQPAEGGEQETAQA